VAPGSTASFIVWVWSTNAAASSVSVAASVVAASYLGTPSFAVCPSASGATCTIASLPLGDAYELLVSVPVSAAATLGANVAFTAQASANGAQTFSASATEVVAAASTATSSSGVVPLAGLPAIPGTSVAPVNPSQLFPTVNPGRTAPNRSRSTVHAADVSSTVPIDARLIGAQLVGLAVLAGAVTIAILRLSLRRRLPTSASPATTVTAAPPVGSGED
jgi:hypothetical protein